MSELVNLTQLISLYSSSRESRFQWYSLCGAHFTRPITIVHIYIYIYIYTDTKQITLPRWNWLVIMELEGKKRLKSEKWK